MRVALLLVLLPVAAALADEPPAAAPPDPQLALVARVEPGASDEGETLRVTVVFRNVGKEPLRLHLPRADSGVVFPEWRFVRSDGVAFTAEHNERKTGRRPGMVGRVVDLAVGASVTVTSVIEAVLRDDPPDGPVRPYEPIALPPGTYEIRCSHGCASDQVPWVRDDGEWTYKRVPKLWIGSVAAEPVAASVHPAVRAVLRIGGRAAVVGDRPAPLRVHLKNGAGRPLHLEGAFQLTLRSKKFGEASARLWLDPPCDLLASDATRRLALPPDGERTWELDLHNLLFPVRRDGRATWVDLLERIPEGLYEVEVGLLGRDGRPRLRSNRHAQSILGGVRPDCPVQFQLEALPPRKGGAAIVRVSFVNEGSEAERVLGRFDVPAQVYLRIMDADGRHLGHGGGMPQGQRHTGDYDPTIRGPLGTLPIPHNWDRSGFDVPRKSGAREFPKLRPGRSVSREIDLQDLVAPDLQPGRYRVRAYWRNMDAGLEHLPKGERAWVGRQVSETVTVVVLE